MEHIEYEERVLIKEADYLKILEDIKRDNVPFISSYIENIYLDSDDHFIKENKMAFRIRTINHKEQELTLKRKNKDNSCVEINETLDKHPLIDKALNNRFSEFHEIARLATERVEVQYDDYLLVVDKNYYHGIIDFDIEIEANSQQKALEIIKNYCKKYDLTYKPDYKSKSHRAIEQAKK